MTNIDLNADLGESFGNYITANDNEILKYISSANIACGFHAGDPVVIRRTIQEAINNDVAVGAHPGYPDLQGFGRRKMDMSPDDIYSYILYQVGAIKSITESFGKRLQHVKAHGALYHSANEDIEVAKSIISAVTDLDPELFIYGQTNTHLHNLCREQNLNFASEAFADRAYNDNGTLVSRSIEGSVINDEKELYSRTIDIIKNNSLTSINGNTIHIEADTICLHGDNMKALLFAKGLHRELKKYNIIIKSLISDTHA